MSSGFPGFPIIATKVRRPRRQPTLLRRERLVSFLHNNIHHKLILISAAAGYGKTSLLIDFAHDTELPVCWYSLDHNDAHVFTFIEYLVASFRQCFPQFGKKVLEALRSYSGPPEAVEPFVRLLLNEIEENTDQYFVLILDDYHHVLESPSVNALLDGLLLYLPEHCHVILASRGIPRHLNLTRLVARLEMQGLGAEHLRFTEDEIAPFLQTIGRKDLNAAQIALLAERSEGWITGVLLAARTNWTGAAHDLLYLSGETPGVFEYLATEILATQPPEIQRFLMGSALLNEMSPPLCDALLDLNNSAQLLRDIASASLFTFRLDAAETLYQYHQLFREFLIARFQQEDRSAYRRLRLRQAELMIHHGHWPQAIDSYLSAEAYGEAAKALEIVVKDTVEAGQWEMAREWLDAIPNPIRDNHPRLLFYRGRLFADMGSPGEALRLLDQAYDAYLALGDEIEAARALIERAVVERFQGRFGEAIEMCHRALRMAGNRDPRTTMSALRHIGICHDLQGRHAQGLEELARALEIAEAVGDDVNAAYITHEMGVAELSQGQLMPGRQHFHRALLYWRKLGNTSTLSMTLQGLGLVHQYLGQYVEAESRLQESLTKARLSADARLEAYALINLGDLYRDVGLYTKAHGSYEAAQEISAEAKLAHLLIYLLIAAGDTYRLQGDLEHAQQLLIEAADQIDAREMAQEAGLCQLALGAVAAQQGSLETAYTRLSLALDLFTGIGSERDIARTRLQLAHLAHAERQDQATRGHLREVARLVRALGSQQFIVAEGPAMLDLLRYAEDQTQDDQAPMATIWVSARNEIEELFVSGPAQQSPTSTIKAPIELLGLQGGQVLKYGQPVTSWESDSARIMAFLFASFPQGLSRDRATEMLWPEVSLDRGNSLFHSTLYRLRQALSKDFITRRDGAYRVNPDTGYRYDVSEFEGLAELGKGSDGLAHIARLQAITLYRSPFLESCDLDWCFELRETLTTTMTNLLLKEAQYQARTDALARAEELYQRLLRLDPLDERAHRGVMWCRAKHNDRSGALRQLRECQQILEEELGVEPSPETVALGDTLLSGDLGPVPD
jgi:LuxR family maltose regulon positive regulatory protein